MKREDLYVAIIAATEITKTESVIIIGSQSILGSFPESALPLEATISNEVDIVPLADDDAEFVATALDAALGEWSEFHDKHDFYVQGVGRATAKLPEGWTERLVPVVPPGRPHTTGLCLDPHDLCAAKLIAHRDHDLIFIQSLISAGLINPRLLRNRIDLIPNDIVDPVRKRIARRWARHHEQRL